MIQELHIKNLILVDSCSIPLSPHLNIVTGESGSGKTAILQALKLLAGQKLDVSLIRKGEKKGSIQALFAIPPSDRLRELLEQASIDVEEDTLIIMREISSEGKSKNLINDQIVSVSFLQKVCKHLFEIVDQHSYHSLRSEDTILSLVDLYGDLGPLLSEYQQSFEHLKDCRSHLASLQELEKTKERELPFYLKEQEELDKIDLKEGEEDALFEEYSLLARSQEISAKREQILDLLSDPPAKIRQSKTLCDTLGLRDVSALLQEAEIAVQESLHLLSRLSSAENNPNRFLFLEQRLSWIDKLKRKYGPSLQDWKAHREMLKIKVERFEQLESEIEDSLSSLKLAEEKTAKLCQELSLQRRAQAQALSLKLTEEIRSLNMAGASVEIAVENATRSSTGEDHLICWLAANAGERPVRAQESSSGGELSRLLFAFQICLADKNRIPTIIFDEIDANVGGTTATCLGEKLQELASSRQVLCITHFPQVACFAHHHLCVHKKEIEGRTVTLIEALTLQAKEHELRRMLGGEKTALYPR